MSPVKTILIGILVCVPTAVAIVFGVLYFQALKRPEPMVLEVLSEQAVQTGAEATPKARIHVYVGEGPFKQTHKVSPKTEYTGTVNYPIPYVAPPNLQLITGKRNYVITKQDEFGFTWLAVPLIEDIKEEKRNEPGFLLRTTTDLYTFGHIKGPIQYEEFTWEAQGIRAPSIRAIPSEQKGKFYGIHKQEGVVNFSIPYDSPPHVALSGRAHCIVITECTEKGFKWKSTATDSFGNDGEVEWVAKGIQSTTEAKKSKN